MKQVNGFWWVSLVMVMPACQPDVACHGGRVMSNGSCIFEAMPMDDDMKTQDAAGKPGNAPMRDASPNDAASEEVGSDAEVDGLDDAGIADSGVEVDAGADAAQPPPPPPPPIAEAPYCMTRTPLADEDKYGQACSASDPPGSCGSLTCQSGANYCTKSCTVGNACTCPGGFTCVSFGGPATACVPTWGRTCTSDTTCRAQAPLCFEGPNFCTSVCDPSNVKTCPDTWSCATTPGGNFCIEL